MQFGWEGFKQSSNIENYEGIKTISAEWVYTLITTDIVNSHKPAPAKYLELWDRLKELKAFRKQIESTIVNIVSKYWVNEK